MQLYSRVLIFYMKIKIFSTNVSSKLCFSSGTTLIKLKNSDKVAIKINQESMEVVLKFLLNTYFIIWIILLFKLFLHNLEELIFNEIVFDLILGNYAFFKLDFECYIFLNFNLYLFYYLYNNKIHSILS
jgi:hypothetical protein